MIIEFFGPPGVGKSTISLKLGQSYEGERSVEQPTYRLSHDVGRWQSHIHKLPLVMSAVIARRDSAPAGDWTGKPIGTVRSVYNWLFVTELLVNVDITKITLLDQGIAQAVWSYAYMTDNNNFEEMVANGLSYSPEDVEHVIVDVMAPAEDIEQRLVSRKGGTEPEEVSLSIGDRGVECAIEIIDGVREAVGSVATVRDDITLVEIQNVAGTDPAENARTLREKIDQVTTT